MNTEIKDKMIILGAGGHARVIANALELNGENILGFLDPNKAEETYVYSNYKVIGDDDFLKDHNEKYLLVNGIGQLPGNNFRKDIFLKYKKLHYSFATVRHSHTFISDECTLKEGCQIMAGSILQTGSYIGENVIINTGSQVDHDSIISAHSHIAPGVTICGNVKIGLNCFIGAGATIIQGIELGDNVVIGAGIKVRKNIKNESIYLGD